MKKFLSVLLMVAMLTSVMIPALTTMAGSASPVVSVAANTDFNEATNSATVKLSLTENPGMKDLNVFVWYKTAEMAVVSNLDANGNEKTIANSVFGAENSSAIFGSASTSLVVKPALQAAGVTVGNAVKCAILSYSTADSSDTDVTGEIATLKFQFAGTPVIGDSYTYGVVIGSATNANDDDLLQSFVNVGGKLTCIDDPYIGGHTEPTLIGVPCTAQVGQTTAKVDIKFDANPGINASKVCVAYPKTIKVTDSENGNIFSDSEYHPGEKNADPASNITLRNAFEKFGISLTDYYCFAVYHQGLDTILNIKSVGTLATITFELPANAVPGTEYKILLCYDTGDISACNGKTGAETEFYNVNPVVQNGSIKIECTHPTTKTVTKDATCTVDGNVDTVCTVCNAVISSTPITAPGHTTGRTETVDATCTVDGSVNVYCSVCNEIINTTVLHHPGHTAGSPVVTDSTCSKEGSTDVYCDVCHELISSDPIAKKSHTPGIPVVTDATCTVDGSSKVYCTVCNELITDTVIPHTGHTAGTPVVVPATCTVDGSSKTYCTVCNELITDTVITRTGHKAGTPVVVPATCTKDGSSKTYCTVCNELIEDKVITATGHTAGKWTVKTPATYTSAGVEEQKCTVCDEVIGTREIPMLTVTATVKYQLADGTSIAADDVTENLHYGDDFTAAVKKIDGYTTTATDKSVVLGESDKNVIVFEYAARTDLTYTISIYDANGNKIGNDIVVNGQTMGTEITVNAPEIEGYTATVKSAKIVIGADNNVIDFKYTKNAAPDTTAPVTDKNNNDKTTVQTGDNLWIIAVAAAVAVIGSGAVVAVRRRKEHN